MSLCFFFSVLRVTGLSVSLGAFGGFYLRVARGGGGGGGALCVCKQTELRSKDKLAILKSDRVLFFFRV